ncbi:MAG: hypothetical protein AB1705_08525 [Verrucomicrobiota bacterium]
MTTAAILGLLGVLAPLLVRWIYRRWARKDDPVAQKEVRSEKINEAIGRGSERGVNLLLDDLVQRVPPAAGGDQRGQAGAPDAGGPGVHAGK